MFGLNMEWEMDYFLYIFKQRLSDCSKQEWLSDITMSPKLNLYREIKSLLEPERYLLEIRNRNLRKTLANFRISCHNLAVEQGRHKNIPLNERICPICQKNGSIYI